MTWFFFLLILMIIAAVGFMCYLAGYFHGRYVIDNNDLKDE